MKYRIAHIALWIASHRKAVWGLHLLTLGLWIFGLLQTTTDFRFQSIVGSKDLALQQLVEYRKHWEAEDANVLILFKSDSSLLSKNGNQLVAELSSEVKALSFVDGVVEYTKWPIVDASDGLLETSTIIDFELLDELDTHKRKALGVSPALLSHDATTALLIAKLNTDTNDIAQLLKPIAQLRDVLIQFQEKNQARLRSFGNTRLYAAGIPALRADVAHEIRTNQLLFLLLTGIVTMIALAFLFRTWQGVCFPLLLSTVALIFVYGVMGLMTEPINMVSQVYISLITVITIADAIHIISTYLRHRSDDGMDGPTAVYQTYLEVGLACFVTSVTTGIGFVSLLSSDMAILRSFGTYATAGVMYAFVLQITMLPTFLLFFPTVKRSIGPIEKLSQLGLQLGNRIVGYTRVITIVFVAASLILLWGASNVDLNNYVRESLGGEHPTMKAHAAIDTELSGTLAYHFDFHFTPNPNSQTLTLERVKALARLEKELAQLSEVRSVMGPSQIIGQLFGSLKGGDFQIPQTEQELGQTLLLLDDADNDPFAPLINEHAGRLRVIATISDIGANASMSLVPKLNQLIDTVSHDSDLRGHLTGVAYVVYKGFNKLATEIIMSLVVATFLISLCIGLLFRRTSWALIALIPNTVPLLAIAALSFWAGWSINPQTAVLFTIALGIAVDDTIHFFNRLHYEQTAGTDSSPEVVIRHTMEHLFPPMFITSVVLGLGFAINIASSFSGARIFGALGATSIFVALIADVTILPVIMLYRERSKQKRQAEA